MSGSRDTELSHVITLDLMLQQSTFSGTPWAERMPDSPSSCGSNDVETGCDRIEPDACPDLVSGENTIMSCGIERTVRIHLPQSHSSQGAYKTVLLFHGINPDQVDDAYLDTCAAGTSSARDTTHRYARLFFTLKTRRGVVRAKC